MTAAQVGSLTLEYETFGEGEPLLLVMGLGAQLIAWPEDFVALLVDQGFQVIRYDNRDIGLSTKIDATPPGTGRAVAGLISRRLARSAYTLADMADDAAGLLDHLGIDRAHVVGASMGGMIAQSLTIGHPHRVASLTSIMSNTGDRRNGKPATKLLRHLPRLLDKAPERRMENGLLINRLVSGPLFDDDEARSLIERGAERNSDPSGMARQTAAINASPDRTKALGRVTAPTLVIHGLVDPLVQPSGGIATSKAVPGSRLLMFPDMGHDLPRPRWPEVVAAITANAVRAGFSVRV